VFAFFMAYLRSNTEPWMHKNHHLNHLSDSACHFSLGNSASCVVSRFKKKKTFFGLQIPMVSHWVYRNPATLVDEARFEQPGFARATRPTKGEGHDGEISSSILGTLQTTGFPLQSSPKFWLRQAKNGESWVDQPDLRFDGISL